MKKKLRVFLIVLTLMLVMIPGLAWARDIGQNITTVTEKIVIQQEERVVGNVTSVSGDITVIGEVLGNVTTATGNINLKAGSLVRGNVTTGTGSIFKDPGANVTGTVLRGTKMAPIHWGFDRPLNYASHAWGNFTSMLGILAIVVILIALLPLNIQKMLGALKVEPGRIILVGCLGWLLLPFLIIISIITIIGPVVLAMGAAAAVLVGVGILGLLIGEKLVLLARWDQDNRIVTAAVGLAALWVASLLPFVAGFVWIASAVIGMGLILVTKFGTNRPWFPPRNPVTGRTDGDPGFRNVWENAPVDLKKEVNIEGEMDHDDKNR